MMDSQRTCFLQSVLQSRIWGLILILLYSVLLYLVFYDFTPYRIFFANDQATDFLIARQSLLGDFPLLGPPSHVGGRHPGPFYYIFVTLSYLLGGRDVYAAIGITALCKCLSVFTLFYMLRMMIPEGRSVRWCVGLLGILLCLMKFPYLDVLRTHWQSNFLFLIGPVAVLSSFPVLKYGLSMLPVFILGASLLFQSHLSSVPVIAGLCAVVGMRLFTNRGNWPANPINIRLRVFQYGSIFLTALLWSPVVYHEIFYPSNFTGLFTLHANPSVKAGVIAAGGLLVDFLLHFMEGSPYREFSVLYKVCAVSLGAFLVARFLRSVPSLYRWQFAAAAIPPLITVVLLSRFRLPLYPHYFNSSVYFPALLSGLLLSQCYFELSNNKAAQSGRFVAIPSLLTLLLLLGIGLKGVFLGFTGVSEKMYPSYLSLGHFLDAKGEDRFRGGDEPGVQTTVITSLESKLGRNGYALFLPDSYQVNLEYKNFFHEVDYFKERKSLHKTERGVYIACPSPHTEYRNEFKAKLLEDWRLDETSTEGACRFCDECFVVPLRQRR